MHEKDEHDDKSVKAKEKEKEERNKPLEERKVPDKIRLQRDSVDAKGKSVRKGDTVDVDTEEWPITRALRHIDKEFAVDANDPDLETDDTVTLDDAEGHKRKAKAKKRR